MPESESDPERGSQCGSQVYPSADAPPTHDNGVLFTLPQETDEDMNKAIMYWVIAFILFVAGWVIFPTFLCLWPVALVLLIVGFRHSQVSNQRRQQANQANQTPPV